jgi:hypothetical protein
MLNLWGDDDPMLSSPPIKGDPYPQQVPFPQNGDAHSEDHLDSINMNEAFDVEDLLNDMLDADSTLAPTITVTVAPLVYLFDPLPSFPSYTPCSSVRVSSDLRTSCRTCHERSSKLTTRLKDG